MAHTPWKQETQRLIITEYAPSMAHSTHLLSLDADNRRFVPDEVFESDEAAAEIIATINEWYEGNYEPLVYPLLLKQDGTHIGHIQVAPIGEGEWEIGYHIGEAFTGHGYATEAARAFIPAIFAHLGVDRLYGICLAENYASQRILEKCGFALQYKGLGPYHAEQQPLCRYVLLRELARG